MVRSLNVCAVFVAVAFLTLVSESVDAQTFLDRKTENSLRMVSYNVNWDSLFDAPDELSRLISAVDADVYSFQELSATSAFEARQQFNQLAPIGGAGWQSHKGRNQVIVSRYDLSLQQTNVPGGQRGIAMAQVDLPDEHFGNDLYLLNNHFPCCGGNEDARVVEAAAIADWIQDGISPGGNFDLASGTAISVLGDLNTVGGPTPLSILLDGQNGAFPDWDGTSLSDARPSHNAEDVDTWTWRNDTTQFGPGVLDYVLYTDSVLQLDHAYVLNPTTMTSADLAASGLQASDFSLYGDQPQLNGFDHLPLIVDFVSAAGLAGDFDQDADVDADDIDFYRGRIGLAAVGELAQLDLDQDNVVTLADHALHVESLVETSAGIRGTLRGDTDLDGSVDVLTDAANLVSSLGQATDQSWSNGDFNADGRVDVLGDAVALVANLGMSNTDGFTTALTTAVPEPNAILVLLAGCSAAAAFRRRD